MTADGFEFWTVEADSKQDAIKRLNEGGGQYRFREIDETVLDFADATASEGASDV